jgi:hypothetical protein
MMASFDAYRQVLQAMRERDVSPDCGTVALADLYGQLKLSDFSEGILERVPEHTLVLPMDGVTWCDLRRPQHLTETLVRVGREAVRRSSSAMSRRRP